MQGWSSDESSDEDDVFLDLKGKPESVSSVSRDGTVEWNVCDDESNEVVPSPVRLEVKDGRAVVVVETAYGEHARQNPARAEDEICRLRYMDLKERKKRAREQATSDEVSVRRSKRGCPSEGGSMTVGKRRKSCEDVWFTTLAQVSGVVDEEVVDEWGADDRSAGDSDLKFDEDQGLEVLFDRFIRGLEDPVEE
jgi:hypothetical protein